MVAGRDFRGQKNGFKDRGPDGDLPPERVPKSSKHGYKLHWSQKRTTKKSSK